MRNDAINIVSRKLGISKERFHQNYEIIGKAMVIREEDSFSKDDKSFGHLMQSSFKLWSVYKYAGIQNVQRTPVIKMISGIHTEVVQREDGIFYTMDPQKVMFSKGNKKERHLLSGIVNENETVLDMFAGIGYFSVPLSFRVKKIYSCEINPDSFHYLIMNMKLNGTRNLVPMLGDSAELHMKDFADRILMGHFESFRYLKKAMSYLKREGTIHLHQLTNRGEMETVKERYEAQKNVVEVKVRKVKSYSPSHDHVVLDLKVKKN